MEPMNNCMVGPMTQLYIEKELVGAGDHLSIRRYSEDAEYANPPHDGQGDCAVLVTDENQNEIEMWKVCGNKLAVAFRLFAISSLHPLEYARVLIQLGHEPMPPASKTILGYTLKSWSNIFKNVEHIRSVDGFFGCYRGLTPKLLGSILSLIGEIEIVERFRPSVNDDDNEVCYERFVIKLQNNVARVALKIILSHPFHVISLRMMAQFVGHETAYTTILGSFLEIYRNDGMSGFFAGLVPRLICDISCVVLTSSALYMVKKYCTQDKFLHQFSSSVMHQIFSSFLYPLQVLSTRMAVSKSGLLAAKTSKMMEYNWIDRFLDIEAREETKPAEFWLGVPLSPIQKEIAQKRLFSITTKATQF